MNTLYFCFINHTAAQGDLRGPSDVLRIQAAGGALGKVQSARAAQLGARDRGAEVRTPPGLLQLPQGGHARAPLRVHAPEALIAVHQTEAARLPRRHSDSARGARDDIGRGLFLSGIRPQRARSEHRYNGHARTRHFPPLRPVQLEVQSRWLV